MHVFIPGFGCIKMPPMRVVVAVWAVAASSVTGCIGTVEAPSNAEQGRSAMRDFVQRLSAYAKRVDPHFLIIPQNGQELLTENGEANGPLVMPYLAAIDGTGREDLFYGYERDNVSTPDRERDYMLGFTGLAERQGMEVFVIDYCWTPTFIDDSYAQSASRGYISFAAPDRDLRSIPKYPPVPYSANTRAINSLADAKNFLFFLNPALFSARAAYLDALRATVYDVLIIDLFFEGGNALTNEEVASLKKKPNGGDRLVVAYISIGEAEDYHYYWRASWESAPPSWLVGENPDWPGNYTVRYWDPEWQAIIFGNDDSYLAKVLEAGFDGAYLDRVDAFEFFEEKGICGLDMGPVPRIGCYASCVHTTCADRGRRG